jgi:hypothetical protein
MAAPAGGAFFHSIGNTDFEVASVSVIGPVSATHEIALQRIRRNDDQRPAFTR